MDHFLRILMKHPLEEITVTVPSPLYTPLLQKKTLTHLALDYVPVSISNSVQVLDLTGAHVASLEPVQQLVRSRPNVKTLILCDGAFRVQDLARLIEQCPNLHTIDADHGLLLNQHSSTVRRCLLKALVKNHTLVHLFIAPFQPGDVLESRMQLVKRLDLTKPLEKEITAIAPLTNGDYTIQLQKGLGPSFKQWLRS